MQIGHGYDIHKLVEGRKLILAGIEIPHERGLLGHSDADVITHAIIDALLGAAALGDIGKHFPDTDPEWKDANSLELLKHTNLLIEKENFKINNIDCTIIAEEPKLSPYIETMKENICKVLQMNKNKVNIKAKTNEGLDSTGQKNAISAFAVVTII